MLLEELKSYMLDENKIVGQKKEDRKEDRKEEKVEKEEKKEEKVEKREEKVEKREEKVEKREEKKEEKVEKREEKKVISPFFYPEQKDQLFWCFYILKYGFSQYEYPGNISFVNEKQEKFKCIDNLRIQKQLLKTYNIKNKDEMEDDLANKSVISQKTFIALCCVEKINVFLIHKHKYFEMCHDDGKIHIIHKINNRYCYEPDVTIEQIKQYQLTLYKCDNFDKPLRAISYYKVSELKDIYKNMLQNINNGTASNSIAIGLAKNKLYELLMQQL